MRGQWPTAQTLLLVACCVLLSGGVALHAEEPNPAWPSLFRGVVVTDTQLGVQIVRVDEASQAYQADLRPGDLLLRIHETDIRTIEEFAVVSLALKGRAEETRLLVFRNGAPRELTLHLYSYPVLRAWGVRFIPDHNIRFADIEPAVEYWMRMGRGFEEAKKPLEALDAYLNVLHISNGHLPAAVRVAGLMLHTGSRQVAMGDHPAGLARLTDAMEILSRLFNHPLHPDQLGYIRDQLAGAVEAMQNSSVSSVTKRS
ncbi:MAG TPA: hypothetical protein VGA56_21580 [Opitutaceae bacterium]